MEKKDINTEVEELTKAVEKSQGRDFLVLAAIELAIKMQQRKGEDIDLVAMQVLTRLKDTHDEMFIQRQLESLYALNSFFGFKEDGKEYSEAIEKLIKELLYIKIKVEIPTSEFGDVNND